MAKNWSGEKFLASCNQKIAFLKKHPLCHAVCQYDQLTPNLTLLWSCRTYFESYPALYWGKTALQDDSDALIYLYGVYGNSAFQAILNLENSQGQISLV